MDYVAGKTKQIETENNKKITIIGIDSIVWQIILMEFKILKNISQIRRQSYK